MGKPLDRLQQAGLLQVPEDLLAVAHRVRILQGPEQDRGDELTLLAVTRDRRDDLVQVQVPRVGMILVLLHGAQCNGRLVQQAGEMNGHGALLCPGCRSSLGECSVCWTTGPARVRRSALPDPARCWCTPMCGQPRMPPT